MSAEYVAIALVVVLMIAAVLTLNFPQRVTACGESVKQAMFGPNADSDLCVEE